MIGSPYLRFPASQGDPVDEHLSRSPRGIYWHAYEATQRGCLAETPEEHGWLVLAVPFDKSRPSHLAESSPERERMCAVGQTYWCSSKPPPASESLSVSKGGPGEELETATNLLLGREAEARRRAKRQAEQEGRPDWGSSRPVARRPAGPAGVRAWRSSGALLLLDQPSMRGIPGATSHGRLSISS